MKTMQHVLLPSVVGGLIIGGYLFLAWPLAGDASDTDLPKPVAALADRGMDIVDTFESPSGLQGDAATFLDGATRRPKQHSQCMALARNTAIGVCVAS